MLKNRKRFTTTVKNELHRDILELKESTRIPLSRLMDEAIEDLLKKYTKK